MNNNAAQPQNSSQNSGQSYVDDYAPPGVADSTMSVEKGAENSPVESSSPVSTPTPAPIPAPAATQNSKNNSNESLENQNIFMMLGVKDENDELKENFLNELQQVIWDDFLENDVGLLITSDEKIKFDELMIKKESSDNASSEEVQDALVAYLETLIPDLEEIMLEKALDLKADLYLERINSMKDFHSGNPENLNNINKAEALMSEEKWNSSTQLLNTIIS